MLTARELECVTVAEQQLVLVLVQPPIGRPILSVSLIGKTLQQNPPHVNGLGLVCEASSGWWCQGTYVNYKDTQWGRLKCHETITAHYDFSGAVVLIC